MNTYLLPCPCGRKIPVELRQAGEMVTCACGGSLEVPTLLSLKALERAEVALEPQKTKTAWAAGHRLIFLGAMVILAAIVIGVWLFWARPNDPYANFTPEQIVQSTENITPVQAWRLWQVWEQGGLERRKTAFQMALADQKIQHRIYWWLLGVLAGTGCALIAAGIIVVDLRKKKS